MPEIASPNIDRKHRCLTCGQLKDESDLYYGDKDWACVDPDHGGHFPGIHTTRPATTGCILCGATDHERVQLGGQTITACPKVREYFDSDFVGFDLRALERQPVREDYNELTTAFARILFEWKFTVPPSVALEDRDRLIRDYFQGGFGMVHGRAYHVLTALVAAALHGRDRMGMSIEDRQRQDARTQMETARAIREFCKSDVPKPIAEILELQQEARAREDGDVLSDIVVPGEAKPVRGIPYYIERPAEPFGFYCPYCYSMTDRHGLTCSNCGKALRSAEPPE